VWDLFDGGGTYCQVGSENGTIMRDEEHDMGARITLERNATTAPYAITCGVYGWMVHTRFFRVETEAFARFEEMKNSLSGILGTIPQANDAQVEAKMRKLAVALLLRENVKTTESALKNVVFRSFDLDLSNDAALVISAEVAGSNAAPGVKDTPAKSITRYITVVARLDFDGIPQKLMANITDSSRLDVTPRLELIDAVDVDGTGPAELLFREYNFDHKSFVIYSVGRNAATKMFEGANQPLK